MESEQKGRSDVKVSDYLVDELTTPGCPNCAVKHLSAALAFLVEGPVDTRVFPGLFVSAGRDLAHVLVARAFVNLAEAAVGYDSHWGYAVGLLVRAEEACATCGDPDLAGVVRSVRVAVMYGDQQAMSRLASLAYSSLGTAHLREACRELPALADEFSADFADACGRGSEAKLLWRMISWVREEYFGTEEKGDADHGDSEEGPGQEGPGQEGEPACEAGGVQGRQVQEVAAWRG